MRIALFASIATLSLSIAAAAENITPPQTFRLITPSGDGSLLANPGEGYVLQQFALYDNGGRASIFFANAKTGVDVSYILLQSDSYTDTSEKCRNAVLGGVIEGALSKATLKDKRNENHSLSNGPPLAIGSYVIAKNLGVAIDQMNLFGFLAAGSSCAEIHISKIHATTADQSLFNALLDTFQYDPAFTPQASDYAAIAALLNEKLHDGSTAKAYAQRASQAGGASLPPDPNHPPDGLIFALASHPGYLQMDAPGYAITELSAKSNGSEFGIRARNKVTGVEVLGFLYLPDSAPQTAIACRDSQMAAESKEVKYRQITGKREIRSAAGVPVAIVTYEQSKKPAPYSAVFRAFVASGGLCADIEFTGAAGLNPALAEQILSTVVFDPARQPDFFACFRFATVVYDHHNVQAAGPLYAAALPFVDMTDDPVQWRRVTTDQASMAYGMAGDLKTSNTLNEAAIAKDPDYPLYYYNLACADAEAGDAAAARKHLQQASDRRANVLKGEHFPDPSHDDSILKLKDNAGFWAFVQALPKN